MKIKKQAFVISVALPLFLFISSSFAQKAPDAGSIRQEIEKREVKPEPKKKDAPLTTEDTKPSALAGEPSVVVASFAFSGNTLLTDSELAEVVEPLLNKKMGFADLEAVTKRVSEAYRTAGWIVHVFLPPQDVSGGTVKISIVEAAFGQARIAEGTSRRIKPSKIVAMVDAQQKHGRPLNVDAMETALLRINDLPGTKVTADLGPGKREKETDLVLKVTDSNIVAGELAVDNTGSKATGEERLVATIALNSPLGFGDQVLTTFLHSEGTDYGRLSATMPIGDVGWRAGLHASTVKYSLLEEFAKLDAKGSSSNFGLDTSYPLIRSRAKNLLLTFSYDDASYLNESLSQVISDYNVSNLTTGLNGFSFDNLGGGGVNRGGFALTVGDVNLEGSPNQAADALSEKTAGSYTRGRLYLSRQQFVTDSFSVYASLNAQLASKNLSSSEKFSLGGASGVRAYPVGEGTGDEGQLVTIEGRLRLPASVGITGFFDWGNVTINHSPVAKTIITNRSALPESYQLKGFGISVNWQSSIGVNVSATVAKRLGTNPAANAAGNDSDGTKKTNRIWLQASFAF